MNKKTEKKISIGLGIGLVLSIILYVIFVSELIAIAGFTCLIGLIILDFWRPSSKKNSIKLQLKETVISLTIAVVAWYLLVFLLNTGSPLNVVTSCSMVPALERGDFIILQGGEYNVQEITVDYPLKDVKYVKENYRVGEEYYSFTNMYLNGENLFDFKINVCESTKRGQAIERTPCTTSLTFNGKKFHDLQDGDIIVYVANPPEYGLIIHRALLKINAADGEYYVTKGDNNRFVDQQAGITIVPKESVQGKVLARIPLIGYAKLFLFLQFAEPRGCDTVINYINEQK